MSEPLEQFMARIYDEKDKKAFDNLQAFLDEHSRNYSDQETFLLAVRLANQKLQEHYARRGEIEGALP